MIWYNIFKELEPEEGKLGENRALMGNSCSQYVIECGNAVCGNKKQVVAAYLIDVAHLSAGEKLELAKITLQQNRVESLSSHEESLDVQIVAYSSRSENFV